MAHKPQPHRLVVIATIVAVALGVVGGYGVAWTCDDAFISFRYAQNLVDGHGLVYNAGERVEGYTNLSWTLWAALGLALGFEAEGWSVFWGIACYGGAIAALGVYHLRARALLGTTSLTLPAAALVAAGHDEWNIWASGGLETSLFTLLSVVGFVVLASHMHDGRHRAVVAGIVLGLCSITRPDGVLFAFLGGVVVLATSVGRVRSAAIYSAAALAVWLPATVWRIVYYGELFPNTYYAKSAHDPWYEQGWHYLILYMRQYWPLLLGIALAALAVAGARGANRRILALHSAAAFGFFVVYSFYVVRVGGDFMYGRMLIPATPFLIVLLDLGLLGLASRGPALPTVVLALVIGACRIIPPPVTDKHWDRGVANEWMVYSPLVEANTAVYAQVLAKFLADLPVRYAFVGGEARAMYKARLPVAIECETGLTDRTIARQELTSRGRVGHEKRASLEYVVRERRAHVAFNPDARRKLRLDQQLPPADVYFGPMRGRLLHWDPGVMKQLAARGAKFTPYPETIDDYLAKMAPLSDEQVAADFHGFELFYFDHVDDPRRREKFLERLESGL